MQTTRFPVLLEVRPSGAPLDGRDPRLGHPTDVALGYYMRGGHPREDRIELVRPLVATAGDERRPRWGPDDTATYVDESGRVLRVDLHGQPVALPAAAGVPVEADWDEDGLSLVTRDDEGRRLWRVDDTRAVAVELDGHMPREVDRAGARLAFVDALEGGVWLRDEGGVRCVDPQGDKPRFSPDGRSVAFVRPSADGLELCVAAMCEPLRSRPLFTDLPLRHVEALAWTPDGARILVSTGRVGLVEGRLVYAPEIWAFSPDGSSVAVLGDGVVVAVEPYGEGRLSAA